MVLRDLGLERAKCNSCGQASEDGRTSVSPVPMRVNYLFLDRPDLSFAAVSLARGMTSTTTRDLEELKTCCGRYLRRRLVGALVFKPQTLLVVLEVFFDADHAGNLGTRKSNLEWQSCWEHLIKHVTAVQSTVALSSGESEHYALLRSSVYALRIKAMLNDWRYGVECEIRIRCDSRAARHVSARQGLEKARHVYERFLWLQQAEKSKDV